MSKACTSDPASAVVTEYFKDCELFLYYTNKTVKSKKKKLKKIKSSSFSLFFIFIFSLEIVRCFLK